MSDSLKDKVAVVTGGGSGIGEALCRELARRGARVVVADINAEDARRVAAAIAGGQAEASTVDVASESEVRRLVEDTASGYRRLDYLFNNAGIAIGGDARDLPWTTGDGSWTWTSTAFCTACVPPIRSWPGRGSVTS